MSTKRTQTLEDRYARLVKFLESKQSDEMLQPFIKDLNQRLMQIEQKEIPG